MTRIFPERWKDRERTILTKFELFWWLPRDHYLPVPPVLAEYAMDRKSMILIFRCLVVPVPDLLFSSTLCSVSIASAILKKCVSGIIDFKFKAKTVFSIIQYYIGILGETRSYLFVAIFPEKVQFFISSWSTAVQIIIFCSSLNVHTFLSFAVKNISEALQH